MRPLGANARAVLALFDEQLGRLAAPSSVVSLILSEKGIDIDEKNLLMTLDRLSNRGELTKILRPKGGAIYTRPRNLVTIPGHRSSLERLPALNIRRRASTSERRYELRKERALRALGDEAVRAGAHDYRYNFKTNRWHLCRTCGRDESGRFGPCKVRIAAEEAVKAAPPASGARTAGNAFASRAKSESRARRRGT